ncbi:polysaccharide pyruvyl transferase family protein [Methylocapsa sp. S129]|uniref:polysaccharide pyruvyl transferase family protein n=1 Tax=Methylocapsa sp. S129 TaxID=1641869 RepID=UPI001FED75D2|nr:polysaccharide pyruvyl transferase family protein [Methylocapsa sp. S129]
MTSECPPLSSYHPVRYWRQELRHELQNFGDYLSEFFLRALLTVPIYPAEAYHLIGSTIAEKKIRRDFGDLRIASGEGQVAFWGCGTRGDEPLSCWALEHAKFFGVRGPRTREVLGLPDNTVLGDPGLLVPLIHPKPAKGHGRTLCITHFHESRTPDDIKQQTGVDAVISAAIPGNLTALRVLIDQIAEADFVLSGALHGAVLACAYEVPFSYFDSGYIDVPFKWADFASSIGVPALFAQTLKEGRAIFADTFVSNYKPLPLTRILAAAPFGVRHAMILKALNHDKHMDQRTFDELTARLAAEGVDSPHVITDAQEMWLSLERRRFLRRLDNFNRLSRLNADDQTE